MELTPAYIVSIVTQFLKLVYHFCGTDTLTRLLSSTLDTTFITVHPLRPIFLEALLLHINHPSRAHEDETISHPECDKRYPFGRLWNLSPQPLVHSNPCQPPS